MKCKILFSFDLIKFQLEDYETKITTYAARIVKLTADIEKMEKNPDSYNDADLDDKKVEIKQVEALVKELRTSISGSKTVFETLRVQARPPEVALNPTDARTIVKTLFIPGHITGCDPDQIGEDLRQERCSADASGIPQGAAGAGGVREAPPGDLQPQHW